MKKRRGRKGGKMEKMGNDLKEKKMREKKSEGKKGGKKKGKG